MWQNWPSSIRQMIVNKLSTKWHQEAARNPKTALQTSVQLRASAIGYNIRRSPSHSVFPPSQTDVDSLKGKSSYSRGNTRVPKSNTGFKRFPFDNFTYYLTLFSKFFSSFPHGTCSLSVSRRYLALDGIYHPFWAAFPNNPTLWKCITVESALDQERDYHPLWCLVPEDLCLVDSWKHFSKLQFAQEACEISNLSCSRFTRRY